MKTSINSWKTSDIKLSKDSAGYWSATHKFQGLLIDGHPFFEFEGMHNERTLVRREAVKILKEMKDVKDEYYEM